MENGIDTVVGPSITGIIEILLPMLQFPTLRISLSLRIASSNRSKVVCINPLFEGAIILTFLMSCRNENLSKGIFLTKSTLFALGRVAFNTEKNPTLDKDFLNSFVTWLFVLPGIFQQSTAMGKL